jgi:hypothetical protein
VFRLAAGILLSSLMACSAGSAPEPVVHRLWGARMAFEPNRGQAASGVDFVARGARYSVTLKAGRVGLALRGSRGRPAAVTMEFAGAKSKLSAAPLNPLSSHTSYFIGNDPMRWSTGVPHFGKVKYAGVYPGIDVVYYGNQQNLEYDLVVAPGAEPESVAIAFGGVDGLRLAQNGDLVLKVAGGGELIQHLPAIYQEAGGVRSRVEGRYRLTGKHTVKLALAAYDRRRPLVIDPMVSYATYLGGSGLDYAYAVTADSSGDIYVAGETFSSNFPKLGSIVNGGTPTGGDYAFVTKLNPSGGTVFSAVIGGDYSAWARGIAVDQSNNVYLAGTTDSTTFPTTANAYALKAAPRWQAFALKLNADGNSLLYSTVFYGLNNTYVASLALGPQNHMWITGGTGGALAITSNAFQNANYSSSACSSAVSGSRNVLTTGCVTFIAGFDPAGSGSSSLIYSTYLSGAVPTSSSGNAGQSIAADLSDGSLYVGGSASTSSAIPMTGPGNRKTPGGGQTTGYLVKLDPTKGTSGLLYSTYVGGDSCSVQGTYVNSVVVDVQHNAYVAGYSDCAANISKGNVFQPAFHGRSVTCITFPCPILGTNAIIAKYAASGASLIWGTYMSGSNTGYLGGPYTIASALALDSALNVYVTGTTDAPGFGSSNSSSNVGYLAKLSPDAASLMFTSFLGTGSAASGLNAIALNSTGDSVVAGTAPSDAALPRATLRVYGGGATDAIVATFPGSPVGIVGQTPTTPTTTIPLATKYAFNFSLTNPGGKATSATVTFSKLSSGSMLTGYSSTCPAVSCYDPSDPTSKKDCQPTNTGNALCSDVCPLSGLNPVCKGSGTSDGTTPTDSTGCVLTDPNAGQNPACAQLNVKQQISVSFTTVPANASFILTNDEQSSSQYTSGASGVSLPLISRSYYSFTNFAVSGQTCTIDHMNDSTENASNFLAPDPTPPIPSFVFYLSCGSPATITSPAAGSTISLPSTNFSWSAAAGATQYKLSVGKSATGTEYANGMTTSGLTQAVSGLPLEGSTIYAVLSTNFNGTWVSAPAVSYKMVLGTAAMISSPASGSTIGATSVTFSWNLALGGTQYKLSVGNSSGGTEYANNVIVAGASQAVSGLPLDGRTIYAVLSTSFNGTWVAAPVASYTMTGGTLTGQRFVPVTPCRIIDTRNANGALGGPILAARSTRTIPVSSSSCGIPANASAYSLNATVVPAGGLGYLSLFPTGRNQPLVSTLNSPDGRIVANAAIVPTGTAGSIDAYVTDTTHLILDINGYFTGTTGLQFYPLTPCRVADTRNASGPYGGPSLTGGQTRTFDITSSGCGIPSTAQAYALNLTVVPKTTLGYLSAWPAGQSQPLVSTLNAPQPTVVANAAIVPAGGAGGPVSLYATDATDLIIDINGFFGVTGSAGMSFYPVSPCRIADTRDAAGSFGGPGMSAQETRSFIIPSSACNIPATARAYSLNATVVPSTALGYLTLWPAGSIQPVVSTLNSLDGRIAANAALLPAGLTVKCVPGLACSTTSGVIAAYVTSATQLILDINGYFAP